MRNNISQLILQLQEAGIRLEAKNGKLSVSAGKGVLTAERQALIKENKDALLQWLNQFDSQGDSGLCASAAHPVELSYGQARFWFMEQIEDSLSAYHIVSALELEGKLDVGAANRALKQIIARHESLRTVFASEQGKPVASLLPEVDFAIDEHDLSASADIDAQVDKLVQQAYHHQFDLTRPPLMAVKLLKLADERHVLVFTLHHIVADAWSMANLNQEFTRYYQAELQQAAADIAPLALQYRDFVAWQKNTVSEHKLAQQFDYWQSELQDLAPILPLPRKQNYGKVMSYDGDKVKISLPEQLTSELSWVAKSQGVTLNNLMLAAFSWLLHRYSGQQDIAIGSAVSLRHDQRLNPLIGLFLNYLVMRNQVDPGLTFGQLIQGVQQKSLQAFANQDLPFEQLVDKLDLERSLSHQPLTQINFSYMNTLTGEVALPDLKVTPFASDKDQAMYELSLSVREEANTLACELEFNTRFYDKAQISAMLGDFSKMLAWAAGHDDLPLFHYLPQVGGDYEEYVGQDASLHAIVEQQARLIPDEPAVSLSFDSLSYRELNEQANILAHDLLARGVKPGQRIAIAMPKDLPLPVAILAVLKTGATYVPLDMEYPHQRLVDMLETSRCGLILVSGSTSLPPELNAYAETLDVTQVLKNKQAYPTSNPEVACSPETPAYIVFTSGSTGKPKAVLMPHRAMVHLVEWSSERVQIERRMLQFASISFDIHCQEMFMTWYQGKHLFLIEGELTKVIIETISYIGEHSIDTVILPAAVMRALSDQFDLRSDWFLVLRNLISTAEAIQFTLSLQHMLANLPDCRLHDFYGPSETHVALIKSYPQNLQDWQQQLSIGRGNKHIGCRILDKALTPVPDGVTGELYLSGACLASGYLDNGAATAEKFIPDPFSQVPGVRMYRTGDLVRRLPNGEIKYIERADFMIKLRGYRIEPGEIENQLCSSTHVKQAYVTKQQLTHSEQLIAYVVPTLFPFDTQAAKEHLRNVLPVYMIPSQIIAVEALPLTANGKVDQAALAQLPQVEQAEVEVSDKPENSAEQVLQQLWQELLETPAIGVNDDFFSIGGHSLLAIQLVNIINDNLGLSLSLQAIFEYATIRELTYHLGELLGGQENIETVCEQYLALSQMSEEELSEFSQALS
ncbi:amino acid adenylation domain-containing protein [Microbulbifer sp. ANSA003]|uniref:amino acid adenylation domain-containing protein n=1 Tax=Microbulbifer sp. ANSA003 TaxID=3243360 RepID=UPI004041DE8E